MKIKIIGLVVMIVINLYLAVNFLFYPETVNEVVIRFCGILWVLESLKIFLDFKTNKNK